MARVGRVLRDRTAEGECRWPLGPVRHAATVCRVSTSGARVLRIGHRAVVALPDAGLVARVNRPDYAIQSLQAEMNIARYLDRAGLPVSAPADDVSQTAVATPDGAVSFWPYLHSVGSNYDPRWLGQTLRRLHGLALPPHLVSLWDPVTRAEQRLTRYAARADGRRDCVAHLSDAVARAKEELPRIQSALGVGLVHGDPLNVIVTAEEPVMIDFDLAGTGPAGWDLASVAMRVHRFGGDPEVFRDFADAYGGDGLRDPSFAGLLSIRELLDCSFALSLVGSDPGAEGELLIRLRA